MQVVRQKQINTENVDLKILIEKIEKIDKKLEVIEEMNNRITKIEKFLVHHDEEVTTEFNNLTKKINEQDVLVEKLFKKILNLNYFIFKSLANELLHGKKLENINGKLIEHIERNFKTEKEYQLVNSFYELSDFEYMNDE